MKKSIIFITIVAVLMMLFGCSKEKVTQKIMDATILSNNSDIKKKNDIVMYQNGSHKFFVLERNEEQTVLLFEKILNKNTRINDRVINVDDFTKTDLYQYLNSSEGTWSGYSIFIDDYLSFPMSNIASHGYVGLLDSDFIKNKLSEDVKSIILKGYGDFWLSSKDGVHFEYVADNGEVYTNDPRMEYGLRPVLYVKTEELR